MTIVLESQTPRPKWVSTRTIKRVQAVSGIVFSVFLVMHFANTWASLLGPGTVSSWNKLFRTNVAAILPAKSIHILYIPWGATFAKPGHFLLAARHRTVYRHPLAEFLLLASVGVHMTASMISFVKRWDPVAQSRSVAQRLHFYTGYALMFMAAGHIVASRGMSLVLGDHHDVDYTIITWSFQFLPYLYYPFMMALGSFGFYHTIYGLVKSTIVFGASPSRIAKINKSWLLWGTSLAGVLLFAISILSLTQGLFYQYPTNRWDDYEEHYHTMLRLVQPWTWSWERLIQA